MTTGLYAATPASALDVSRLIAPPSACDDQRDPDAAPAVQEQAMRCMTNFARRHANRGPLRTSRKLDTSAEMKSRDIVRCDSFSHYACGRDFTYWMKRVGYLRANCWRAGENIAWGSGSYGSVRSVFTAWMHSPGHRDNILSGDYRSFGVGFKVGGLGGYRSAHVWVQHFGEHC
jgi:uncharacterized protein YkwD